ncbi:MAG: hypothetical protein J6A23_02755 [Thermoguttaceae bacterium]|nr:hypothetical protein [Thermoguttaceae bacterium]
MTPKENQRNHFQKRKVYGTFFSRTVRFSAFWIFAGALFLFSQWRVSALGEEGELLPVWDEERITVLGNQGAEPVRFWIEMERGGQRTELLLRPGETLTISNPQAAAAVFDRNGELTRLRLLQDEVYLFVKQNGIQELYGIGPDHGTLIPQSRIQGRNSAKDTKKSPKTREESSEFEPKHSSSSQTSSGTDPPQNAAVSPVSLPILTLPVHVFTDMNIPLAEKLWRQRITERVANASEILEKTCFVRLEIEAFHSWESDPKSKDLREVMGDFEKKVPNIPGKLVMGFTAHQNASGERTELGLARQPFYGRILLREEAPQITEVERLETLLHEMGHFLGAVHTSDENSVMRTILHERRSRHANFTISFDPLNALAMNLWVRQFCRGDRIRIRTIHPDVRDELENTYRLVQQIAMDQKAAGLPVLENPNLDFFLKILEKMRNIQNGRQMESKTAAQTPTASQTPPGSPRESGSDASSESQDPAKNAVSSKTPSTEDAAAQSVEKNGSISEDQQTKTPDLANSDDSQPESDVQKLQDLLRSMTAQEWETEKTDEMELPVRTARFVLLRTLLALAKNEPLKDYSEKGKQPGDILGEKIVRYAAWAAMEVGGTGDADSPEGKAARGAFLLACQVCLEPTGAIGKVPVYGRRFRAIETPEIRKLRQNIVGNGVSIFGATDYSQHFWVSAALTIQIAPLIVETVGVEKELSDDREGGSGFDVIDLNADVAGIWFGKRVMDGKIPLEKIGRAFTYPQIVPSQIRIPKRLKHPTTHEEIQELLEFLRRSVHELQDKFTEK